MKLSDFDFDFPKELIARRPAEKRDASRLLVLNRLDGKIRHGDFPDIIDCFAPGDAIVINQSKVLAARLQGRKSTGGRVEILLVRPVEGQLWLALCPNAKPDMEIELEGGARLRFEKRAEGGEWIVHFGLKDIPAFLREHGRMPLPPYIRKARADDGDDESALSSFDTERYQTVYAQQEGSIAAPTAGLHFTDEILNHLRSKEVEVVTVTLHVGWGTFKPVTATDPRKHTMLPEWFEMDQEAAQALRRTKNRGGQITAVGTTTVRTLESVYQRRGRFEADRGEANLFIFPGFAFRAIDRFLTNFHLPKSTPLLMASAFAGRERILKAYREAVKKNYRLFSYGDAMLIS